MHGNSMRRMHHTHRSPFVTTCVQLVKVYCTAIGIILHKQSTTKVNQTSTVHPRADDVRERKQKQITAYPSTTIHQEAVLLHIRPPSTPLLCTLLSVLA